MLTCIDVRRVITERIRRLERKCQLQGGALRLCVAGDFGGSFTKLGMLIGNVKTPGNASNFTLLGCYMGKMMEFNNLSNKIIRCRDRRLPPLRFL